MDEIQKESTSHIHHYQKSNQIYKSYSLNYWNQFIYINFIQSPLK
ncbi:hypothetical protein pb186bvf_016347 [Paramecium bursaria]